MLSKHFAAGAPGPSWPHMRSGATCGKQLDGWLHPNLFRKPALMPGRQVPSTPVFCVAPHISTITVAMYWATRVPKELIYLDFALKSLKKLCEVCAFANSTFSMPGFAA